MGKFKSFNVVCKVFNFILILLFASMFLYVVEREAVLTKGEPFIEALHKLIGPMLDKEHGADTVNFIFLSATIVGFVGSILFGFLRKKELKKLLSQIPVLTKQNKKLLKKNERKKAKIQKQALKEQKLKEKVNKIKEPKPKKVKVTKTEITVETEKPVQKPIPKKDEVSSFLDQYKK